MNKKIIFFGTVFLLLSAISLCVAQKLNQPNAMTEQANTQSPHVLFESDDVIHYLTYVLRYDSEDATLPQQTATDNFFLQFDIQSKNKSGRFSSSSRYMMSVATNGDAYSIKLRMESKTFYENGENMGHASPSGEWFEDSNGYYANVLNYYLNNKDSILISHNREVDLSKLNIELNKSLLVISQTGSYEQHLVDITRNESLPLIGNGDFILDTKLLQVDKFINAKQEPINYSIGHIVIHYIPEGGHYRVRKMHKTSMLYHNAGKDFKERTVSDKWEDFGDYADQIHYFRKVLEYYTAHKSEILPTAEIQPKDATGQ